MSVRLFFLVCVFVVVVRGKRNDISVVSETDVWLSVIFVSYLFVFLICLFIVYYLYPSSCLSDCLFDLFVVSTLCLLLSILLSIRLYQSSSLSVYLFD